MDYTSLYNTFINYFKSVDIVQRIKNRNSNDFRLNDTENIYTEKHHIIPRHDGGTDDLENIVVLLPEEHVFMHLLRYKAYNQRGDMLAVRFCINGLNNKSNLARLIPTKKIMKSYMTMKQLTSNFRNKHGWQTPDGIRRISEARKGKFPAVDALTGESVGSVSRDHPNILAGIWQHHSKGKISVTNLETGERSYVTTDEYKLSNKYKANVSDQSGSNNGNYKEMTPDRKRRLFDLIPNSCEDNHLIRKLLLKNIKLEFTEFKKVSLVWVTNNFESLESLVNEYNSLTGSNIQYSSYFRSTKNKDKISRAISGREWYNDGERNYHLNPEIDEIPKHYIKGMLRGK